MNSRFAICDLRLNRNAGLRHGTKQKTRLKPAGPDAGAPRKEKMQS